MMCVDPNKRLTMAGVLEHPWLASDHDNISRLEKMMYPTLPTTKSSKRAVFHEDAEMEDDGDTPATASSSNGRTKRVKH
jgi:hypothetical protein